MKLCFPDPAMEDPMLPTKIGKVSSNDFAESGCGEIFSKFIDDVIYPKEKTTESFARFYGLVKATHYLEMESFLDLLLGKIASSMYRRDKQQTNAELMLGLDRMTLAEEVKLRQDNLWIFEDTSPQSE